jgi:integrase
MPYREGKKWRAVVTRDGTRYQALLTTKREAVAWEGAKRKELMESAKRRREGMDLMTFCTKYLDDSSGRVTHKTYDEKQGLCRRILEVWGANCLVDDVTPDMVLSYLQARSRTTSNNASNKDRKNLLAMWNWGEEILDLQTNPISKTKKLPHDRAVQYVPPEQDVLKVLIAARRDEKVLLDCFLLTGARRSEILRWTWADDINFDHGKVRLGTRKTRDGSMEYEWVPMADELHESLFWWWTNRPEKESPYVFPFFYHPDTKDNNWKGEQRAARWLRALCKGAGVTPFGFHALRRYVASMLADKHKVSAKTIQRVLRHKNLATTERYIKQLNPDLKGTLELLSEREIPENDTRKEGKAANGQR